MVNTRKSVLSGSALAPLAIGALVRGRIGLPDALGYWLAQLVGGLLAAVIACWVIHPTQVHTLTLSGHLLLAAFVAEPLFTFDLCYVVPAAVIAYFIGDPDRQQRQPSPGEAS